MTMLTIDSEDTPALAAALMASLLDTSVGRFKAKSKDGRASVDVVVRALSDLETATLKAIIAGRPITLLGVKPRATSAALGRLRRMGLVEPNPLGLCEDATPAGYALSKRLRWEALKGVGQ